MPITDIFAREIFDSRGIPTIECEVVLDDEISFFSSVPSGISRGIHEAVELRDGGKRLMGKGVKKAIKNIEKKIAPALMGQEPHVVEIDKQLVELDGTDDKSKLGSNSILATSIAVCRAHAFLESVNLYELIADLCDFDTVSLPMPLFNVINGGLHANNNLAIQEILIMPFGQTSFHAAMEVGVTIFHTLKEILKEKGKSTAVGDEGGFAPNFTDEKEAFDLLMQAIERSQQKNIFITLDIAASRFYNAEKGMYAWQKKEISAMDLVNYYQELIESYPIYSIEDGLSELDWDNWKKMKEILGDKVKLIGDDIFATNPQRIWDGIEQNIATAALIKPNQIGTITETLQAIQLCKESNWDVIVSHRSGETNDAFITDLAVGVSANHIKAGGCSRGERMAKYNRLLAIEDDLLSHE